MWDHVRGNERDAGGRLKMGRNGWFDEVMRFFDEHVRGQKGATSVDPPVVVQTSDGSWRGETEWPPGDATSVVTRLRGGSYYDDANVFGTGEGAGSAGVWTVSPPLRHDAHLAGVPDAALRVAPEAAGANLVVDLYDVDPEGSAILVSRNTTILPEGGYALLELYGNDWRFLRGHRIAALVTSSNSEWWAHEATNKTVEVLDGRLQLPFLRYTRPDLLPGTPPLRLEEYREDAPFTVPAETLSAAEAADFQLPPPQRVRPVPLSLTVSARGRTITVSGRAKPGRRLRVVLARKGARPVTRKLRAAADGGYRVRLRVRARGRYRVTVTSGAGERRRATVAVKRAR
jgi:hypothetical protein